MAWTFLSSSRRCDFCRRHACSVLAQYFPRPFIFESFLGLGTIGSQRPREDTEQRGPAQGLVWQPGLRPWLPDSSPHRPLQQAGFAVPPHPAPFEGGLRVGLAVA